MSEAIVISPKELQQHIDDSVKGAVKVAMVEEMEQNISPAQIGEPLKENEWIDAKKLCLELGGSCVNSIGEANLGYFTRYFVNNPRLEFQFKKIT